MYRWFLAVCFASVLIPFAAYSHPGPLDSYGCHPNTIHGTYHCHEGPLAGRQFESKEVMLRVLQEQERSSRPKPQVYVNSY